MNIKLRLIILSFFQFAVWGAYLTSMGNYLGSVGLGPKIGLFYAMQGIVSIFMPAIMGIIADRWIAAQRLLGYCHFLAAVFLFSAGFYGMNAGSQVKFSTLFTLYSLSVAFYMPTIALSNSAAYIILLKNNYDTIKAFPPIRTFGTIGFICAMLFVNFAGISEESLHFNFFGKAEFPSFQNNYMQFFVSAILGIILFIYTFTLPKCEIKKNNQKISIFDALGLKAFSLFKDRK